MNIKELCINRLKKLEPIYIFYEKNYNESYRNKEYWVLYKEKNIVKYASISDPYYRRSGPRVVATLKSNSYGNKEKIL